jgi:hypothetical protein
MPPSCRKNRRWPPYVNFFLTNVNEVVSEVGYFPASTAAINAAKQAWADAQKRFPRQARPLA